MTGLEVDDLNKRQRGLSYSRARADKVTRMPIRRRFVAVFGSALGLLVAFGSLGTCSGIQEQFLSSRRA